MIRGLIEGREGEVEIAWHEPEARRFVRQRTPEAVGIERGLEGDEDLVRRAIFDEAERRTFRATQTGPFFEANLDDAHVAVLQLGSYFRPGLYRISGKWPRRVYPVGEDAVA